ncbi:MAG: hypothetical protein WBA28_05425 [Microbacteriaceae bacterium]
MLYTFVPEKVQQNRNQHDPDLDGLTIQFPRDLSDKHIDEIEKFLDREGFFNVRLKIVNHTFDANRSMREQEIARKHHARLGIEEEYVQWYQSWMEQWLGKGRASGIANMAMRQRYGQNPLNVPSQAILWMMDWTEMRFTPEMYAEMDETRQALSQVEFTDKKLETNYQAEISLVTARFGRYGWREYPTLRAEYSPREAVLRIAGVHNR